MKWFGRILLVCCFAIAAFGALYPTLGGKATDNAVSIANDGGLVFSGTARRINEIWINAGGIKAAGSKPATAIAHGQLEVPVWQFSDESVEANEQSVSVAIRVPSRMDRLVAPVIAIGWSTTTTDPGNDSEKVEFQFEYLWTSEDESTAAAAQETLYSVSTASTVAEGMVFAIITGIDPPSATDICIHCKLKRLSSASAGSSADSIADDIELHGICMQFTSNKTGAPL